MRTTRQNMVEPVRSKDPILPSRPAVSLADAGIGRLTSGSGKSMSAPERLPSVETSTDGILGGRILLEQPVNGYRAAIDPVLLAASVRAGRGERVLDAGLGVGAASLCLAARLDGIDVVGVEIQSSLAALALKNAAANGLGHRVQAIAGAIEDPALVRLIGPVDQVITNPPYQKASRGRASPDPSRDRARREGDLGCAAWVDACRRFLKHRGRLTIIYRADRLDELLAALAPRFGDIRILPLLPDADFPRPAKLVIVGARLGARAPLRLMPGIALHDGGGYAKAVASVLREMRPIEL